MAHAATAIHSHTLGAGKNGDSLNRAGDIKSELVIPIMLRQVHSLVRITEAQARLTLSPIVTEGHVDEAVRLFLGSMMDAVLSQSGAPSQFVQLHLCQQNAREHRDQIDAPRPPVQHPK